MSLNELLSRLVLAEKDPIKFFGCNPSETLKHWHKVTHPDRHTDKELAQSYFTRFTLAFESLSKPIPKITLKGKEYSLVGKPIIGDTSDVYFSDKIIKVGRLKELSVGFAKNEADCLKSITDAHFAKYVPQLIENHKQVNIFALKEDFTALSELSYVDGKHVAWITKRLLEILGYVHSLGMTHGGITPDNILIFKKDHGIHLIDWKFGGKSEVKKSKKHIHLYPNDEKVTAETDIYMAIMSIITITSNDLPYQIKNFFKGCVISKASMRPSKAWELHDELSEILFRLYGKSKFVEMK